VFHNCFSKTPKEQHNRLPHSKAEQHVCAQLGFPSVPLGCNMKCNRNSCNSATNYYRTCGDSKCCSTCTLPHFVCYPTSKRVPTYGCAMAQPVSCWPLSVKTNFNGRSAHGRFALDTVALGQVFLQVFWPFTNAPYSFIYHQQFNLSN
jgi:hypothetical protein